MPGGFDEALHPRANNGKFSQGGGGGKASKKATAHSTPQERHAAYMAEIAAKAAGPKKPGRSGGSSSKVQAARESAKAKAVKVVSEAKAKVASKRVASAAAKDGGGAAASPGKPRAAAKEKAAKVVAEAKQRAKEATPGKAAAKPAGESATPAKAAAQQPKAATPSDHPKAAPTAATNEHLAPAAQPSPVASNAKPMTAQDFKAAADRTYSHATSDEVEATKMYSGSYFSNINKSLREPGAKVREAALVEHSIKHLDSLMEKSKTANDVVTYRGAEAHPAFADLKVGQTFTDDAYVSTAIDQRSAFGGTHLFHITSPAGTKVAPIAGGASELEGEMLIGRGAQMRLDKIEQRTHPEHGYPQTVMHFTVIGQR